MAGHLSADTASALGRRREIRARRRAAHRELDAAEQRLAAAEKRAGHSVAFVEVAATLEAGAATGAEVELSYHVSGASWRPLYDLALDGERLAVTYLAEVTQQTGEDWPAVELVMSTTRRGLHQTLPELPPWYIGHAQPVRRPMAAGRSKAFTGAVPPSAPSPMAAAPAGPGAPEADLEEAALLAAEPGESGVGLIYRVPRPLAVPADGGPHKTTVAWFELGATLDHLTVPFSRSRPTCGQPSPTARRCCCSPARHVSSVTGSSSDRRPWRPSPLARSSSSSSGWTTRSGSNANCAAAAPARP
jgi:uncharacterized protein (TIGR02231 family)